MVLINIYTSNTSSTFFHGLSGYYKCKIVGWCYADTAVGNTIVGVNINELRVPSNPFTYTFVKNATTSHYCQKFPSITAQLNQYFTINLVNAINGAVLPNFSGFTLYMECEEITTNNLISN